MEELIKYYCDLLIIQYRNKPKARATIETLVRALFEDINGKILPLEFQNAFNLDTAQLAQLKILAKYVGYDDNLNIINTNYFKLSDMEGADETPGLSDYEDQYEGYPLIGYAGYTYSTDTLTGVAGIEFYRKVLGFLIDMKNEVLSLGNLDKYLYKHFENDIIVVEGDKTIKYVYSEAILKLFNLDATTIETFIKKYMPRPMGCGMENPEFKPNKYLEFTINTTDSLIYTINYNSYEQLKRIMVDWGDGTSAYYTSSDTFPTHTYSQQQDYTIKVISLEGGALPAIIFGNQYRPDTHSNMLKSIDFNNCFFQHSETERVKIFDFMFCNCTNLTSIHKDLFKCAGTDALSFHRTFYNCGLTTIPADLFKYNTKATIFTETFAYNPLEEIPDGLFRYVALNDNPKFDKAFYDDYTATNNCKINPNIFCDEATEKTTRFKNSIPSFYMTFVRGATFAGTQGTAPELWNYTFKSAPTVRNCFLGQDSNSLSNYSNIPSIWGGN